MGHVRDCRNQNLELTRRMIFAPEYVVSAKKKDKVKELQALAAKADKIILATDPDREGEQFRGISRHFLMGR